MLDIVTEGQKILFCQGVNFVETLIHSNYDIYQSLVYKTHSKLFMVNIYQTFIFQQWCHVSFIGIPNSSKADILYKFTEEEWYTLCNAYIYEKLQNPSLVQTNTGSSPHMEDSVVELSL